MNLAPALHLLLAPLLALAACGGTEIEPIDIELSPDGKADGYGDAATIRCVSDALEGAKPRALRLSLEKTNDGAIVRGGVGGLFDAELSGEAINARGVGSIAAERIELSFEGGAITLERMLTGLYDGQASLVGESTVNLSCYEATVFVVAQYADGGCVNRYGERARNPLSIQFVRETGYGECADLAGLELNGTDVSYPDLSGWNLRGSDLTSARLFFAELLDSDLSGATTTGFAFGYATVSGLIDNHTIDPPCAPEPGATAIRCQQ